MCSRGDPALLLFLDIFLDDKETIVRFLGDKVNAFEFDRFLDDKETAVSLGGYRYRRTYPGDVFPRLILPSSNIIERFFH